MGVSQGSVSKGLSPRECLNGSVSRECLKEIVAKGVFEWECRKGSVSMGMF